MLDEFTREEDAMRCMTEFEACLFAGCEMESFVEHGDDGAIRYGLRTKRPVAVVEFDGKIQVCELAQR